MSAPDSEISVQYRVGFGNYVAFFGAWLKRSLFDRVSRRRLLVYAGILGVVQGGAMSMLALPLLVGGLPGPVFWAIIAITLVVTSFIYAAIFVFILGPLLQFLWHTGRYLFNPKVEQTVSLSTAGLTKTLVDAETTTTWRTVTALVETRKTLLLFTSRNAAMIIPKSAFASGEEADQFVAAARHHWEDAHSIF
ncbi:MAG TPA: YcxB family protein [Polyangia bacterium]|nr:YcxB family protein [Polyangia bacterium]